MGNTLIARVAVIAVTAVAFLLGSTSASAAPPDALPMPERVVAVGGIFGEYDHFVKVLTDAKIIDEDGAWIAGGTHLVIPGNLVGPGLGLRQVIDLTRRLENEAAHAGGMVHVLLGRLEIDLLHHNFFSVHPSAYQDLGADITDENMREFIDRGMEQIRDAYPGDPDRADRAADLYWRRMQSSISGGAIAFLRLFEPGEELGDWLRSRNTVITLGDFVFSHGGVSLRYAGKTIREINESMRSRLQDSKLIFWAFEDNEHPAWSQIFVGTTETQMQRILESALHYIGARAQVVGVYTSRAAPVRFAFRGRVFYTVSGVSMHGMETAQGDRVASLEIVGDRVFAYWDGERIDLPTPGPVPPTAPLELP